jgi:ketosteroid isomerase-like protein
MEDTLTTVNRFGDAFNSHDVDAIMALMTDDCIFENTSPSPDGERYTGAAAVRGFWTRFFADAPQAKFIWEEIFASDDRATVRWTYHWSDTGHIRGVDVIRVRDGKVSEKLSYVKG